MQKSHIGEKGGTTVSSDPDQGAASRARSEAVALTAGRRRRFVGYATLRPHASAKFRSSWLV